MPSFRLVLPLLSVVLLAGCETRPNFPPACPQLALLREAADLTRYAPGGTDIRALMIDAKLVGAPASCKYDNATTVRATLAAVFDVQRGPAASGRRIDLPYFVAVLDQDRIREEADYRLVGSFPPNTDAVRLTGEKITLVIPVTREKSAAAYRVFVGFRLSPDELALNRARGPR